MENGKWVSHAVNERQAAKRLSDPSMMQKKIIVGALIVVILGVGLALELKVNVHAPISVAPEPTPNPPVATTTAQPTTPPPATPPSSPYPQVVCYTSKESVSTSTWKTFSDPGWEI